MQMFELAKIIKTVQEEKSLIKKDSQMLHQSAYK